MQHSHIPLCLSWSFNQLILMSQLKGIFYLTRQGMTFFSEQKGLKLQKVIFDTVTKKNNVGK